jgi:hypothetical protein
MTNDGWRNPAHSRQVNTSNVAKVEIVADAAHCTPIEIHIVSIIEGLVMDHGKYALDPGEGTSVLDLRRGRGTGVIQISAKDAPGGTCGDGLLGVWKDSLAVTTSRRVRR